jgi:hypothetical protein
LGYFCNLKKKLPEVKDRPMDENSPNQVTLEARHKAGLLSPIEIKKEQINLKLHLM